MFFPNPSCLLAIVLLVRYWINKIRFRWTWNEYSFYQQLQLVESKFCLDRLGRGENRQIGIFKCHGYGYSQAFSFQKNQQIVFHHSLCLSLAVKENHTKPIDIDSNDPNILQPEVNTTNHVVLLNCNMKNGTKWSYDEIVRKYPILGRMTFLKKKFHLICFACSL